MKSVRAKKHLGQHFLKEPEVAQRLADAVQVPLQEGAACPRVLEIGPGMGVLTQFLLQKPYETWAIELDAESIPYLVAHYPQLAPRLVEGDFLRWSPPASWGDDAFALVGNFPYNISTQIVFRLLEMRNRIPELVGMFQKEVAERLAAPHGSKVYGITSVLTQAYFDVTYLFTVSEGSFNPPPKVKSAVIRVVRHDHPPTFPYGELAAVVKTAFNQRRKTLRNALKSLPLYSEDALAPWADRRAEQLSVAEFVELTERLYRGS
jgi:16S rRNA (adenine1518-N6/adenine1519-N6)-dimethyltransferase